MLDDAVIRSMQVGLLEQDLHDRFDGEATASELAEWAMQLLEDQKQIMIDVLELELRVDAPAVS